MKYWEFLIQKEGDQTWLPLASQQIDILAGRYRVIAHTDRISAPLEIRIAQLLTDDLSSQPKIRQRTDKTNESGLVLVMPYVNLQPGQWALTCSSLDDTGHANAASEDGWQYGLKLQVFSGTEEDGPMGWPAGSAAAHRSADSNGSAIPLVNRDLPLAQAQLHQQMTTADFSPASEMLSPSYRVSLRQQAYLAQQNQPMTIMGQVNALSQQQQEDISELWICLQDPQTAAAIMEAHRPLSLARLPADFKVQIQLPPEVTTQLILGEVSLRADANAAGSPSVLASTAFTITAGIDRQLAAIASQDTGPFEEASGFSDATPPLAEQNSSDDISIPALDPTQRPSNPAIGGVQPPDTDRNFGQPPPLQPELPDFVAYRPAAEPAPSGSRSSMVSQPAQFVGTSIENDDLEADEIAAVLEDIDQDLRLEDSDLNAFEPPEIDLPANQPSDTSFDLPASETESKPSGQQAKAHVAFQSLKLKDHFWQRLSALTHESHQEAAKIAEGMEAAGISRQRSIDLPVTSEFSLDDEVVIYDDEPTATQSAVAESPTVPVANRQESVPAFNTDRSVLPSPPAQTAQSFSRSDQPEMALPVISVPVGDLVAGELVTVTVRTRPSAYKPFLKLWMVDRQSRTLVTEPQTLTDLLPDALGDWQSTAQLQVPMDCLDVQIAAIAIDMATREESGKAVVNRHVVPAGQSSGNSRFRL